MESVANKAKNIKLLITDVDGVLTDCRFFLGNDGSEYVGFNVQDGLGLKLLQRAGITVAIISGRKSELLQRRANQLGIQHLYLGREDKKPAYQDLLASLEITDEQVAYIGDDLPDLPLIQRVGLGVAVPNGVAEVQEHADYVCHKSGGKGAVRELCELLIKSQGKWQEVTAQYFHNAASVVN